MASAAVFRGLEDEKERLRSHFGRELQLLEDQLLAEQRRSYHLEACASVVKSVLGADLSALEARLSTLEARHAASEEQARASSAERASEREAETRASEEQAHALHAEVRRLEAALAEEAPPAAVAPAVAPHLWKKWEPILPAALAFRVRRRSLLRRLRRLVPRDGVALPCTYDRISVRKPALNASPEIESRLLMSEIESRCG